MADVTKPIVAGVDDDFRIRESIESLLESVGYAPVLFSSGEEFLQSGTLYRAICVVTDVRMPGMDGIELQRRIKAQRPKLPVIFISAHYDDETRSRALHEGAAGFLYKPFDTAELLDTIQAALSNSRQQ
jgi:FixJ family two-component response regulator